jgi:hypothetical protein
LQNNVTVFNKIIKRWIREGTNDIRNNLNGIISIAINHLGGDLNNMILGATELNSNAWTTINEMNN